MKKILSILLALLVGLMPLNSFAASQPSQDADPLEWERHAEYIERTKSPEEAAAVYKIAAEKYCEYIADEIYYFGPAKNCFNKAIELFKVAGVYDEALKCYEALGDAAFGCGKYQEANDAYVKAIELSESLDIDEKSLGVLLEKLGDTFVYLQKYREAADKYSSALYKIDSSDETYADLCLKYARALEADGLVYDEEGNLKIAKAFTDAAVALATGGRIEESIANIKNSAQYYEKAGEIESAKKAYATLIFELAQAGKLDIASLFCFELYDVYGANEHAAALFTNIAFPYYESIGDFESAALSYEKAGDCYKEIGDTELAKECYEEAADYYEKAGNTASAEAMKEKSRNCSMVGSIIAKGNIGILITVLALVILIVVVCIFVKRKRSAAKRCAQQK